MQEREEFAHSQAPQSDLPADETEFADDAKPAEAEGRVPHLLSAVNQLLDALDRCAGDPPDCPHCGPARAFALSLVNPDQPEETHKTPKANEQERISFGGRVGADPTFRVTPKGTLIARFPLAVRDPDNSTTWHQVLAFNQRAEQLKDSLTKGEPVQVVGYVHTREGRTREGQLRTIREVYAVTVTRRA